MPRGWLLGWLAVTAPREEKPLQLQLVTPAPGQGSTHLFLTLSDRAPSERGLGPSKGRIS